MRQEWHGLAQKQLQRNLEGLSKLAHCRSVQDFAAVQSGLIRESLQLRCRADVHGGIAQDEVFQVDIRPSMRRSSFAMKTVSSPKALRRSI